MEGMITRAEWGAVPPRWTKNMTHPIEVIRPTFTETEYSFDKESACEILQDLQQTALGRMRLPDIQWNFMIGTDGTIYEGRGWFTEGYKTKQTKKDFGDKVILEVGYIGKADGIMKSLDAASMSLRKLIRFGVQKGIVVVDYDILPVGPAYRNVQDGLISFE